MQSGFRGLNLVLPAKADSERDAVASAWTEGGGSIVRLDRFWEPPPLDVDTVRIYGPTTFALVLREIWPIELVSPPDDLITSVPAEHLRRSLHVRRLDQLRPEELPLFVKPVVPKLFRAAVYDTMDGVEAETKGLDPATAIIVSEPVSFVSEVRLFCLDRTVRTWAAYEGDPDEDETVASFAAEVLYGLPYSGPLVLDIGRLDRGWAVIEFNEAWGAGLNGCDPNAAAVVIESATRRRAR